MTEHTSQNQRRLNLALSKACIDGDLNQVKSLLKLPKSKISPLLHHDGDYILMVSGLHGHFDMLKYLLSLGEFSTDTMNKLLTECCEGGHLNIVKYLLTSPAVTVRPDNLDPGFVLACQHGYMSLVKYLLTSTDLTVHADIHAQNDDGFVRACAHGHLSVVRYLLTSAELTVHADIHAQNDAGFVKACERHYHIVEYLASSPELIDHANLAAQNNLGFRNAYYNCDLETVKFLLTHTDFVVNEQIEKMVTVDDAYDDMWFQEEVEEFMNEMNDVVEQIKIEQEYLTKVLPSGSSVDRKKKI